MLPGLTGILSGISAGGSINLATVFKNQSYTGAGTGQTIATGLDHSTLGSLVMTKDYTSGSEVTYWSDSVRGASTGFAPGSTAVPPGSQGMTAFSSTGFTLANTGAMDGAGQSFISHSFIKKAGFFDIVTYTGNNSTSRQISHIAGSPQMVVIKAYDANGSWYVWTPSLTVGRQITFNASSAETASGASAIFGNGSAAVPPTSSQTQIGLTVNATGVNYVMYVFGGDGNFNTGTYTGNGSSTGPTVTAPRNFQFLIIKRLDTTGIWQIFDTIRGIGAGSDPYYDFSSAAQNSNTYLSPTGTGFQLTNALASLNATGGNYMYWGVLT